MMKKDELLNLKELHDMAAGDKKFLNKVAEEFELMARETLVELNQGLTSANLAVIRSAVHRIKPNFSYLGMEQQAKDASVIILKIDHDGNNKEIINMAHDLTEDIHQAINEVQDVKSTWK